MNKHRTGVILGGLCCPSDAAVMAGVSRATLRRRSLKGELTVNYAGGKLFYLLAEILQMVGEVDARTDSD